MSSNMFYGQARECFITSAWVNYPMQVTIHSCKGGLSHLQTKQKELMPKISSTLPIKWYAKASVWHSTWLDSTLVTLVICSRFTVPDALFHGLSYIYTFPHDYCSSKSILFSLMNLLTMAEITLILQVPSQISPLWRLPAWSLSIFLSDVILFTFETQ